MTETDAYRELKMDVTQSVIDGLKNTGGMTVRAAVQEAIQIVKGFERAAQAAWSPATGGMPETPKLKEGDTLLVVRPKTRYMPLEVQPVTVAKMARFKVTVSGPNGLEEFDVRSRRLWETSRSEYIFQSGRPRMFYTEEQWAYQLRADQAAAYLRERGIYGATSVSGPLLKIYNNDVVGFANALRRLEGLVEL